jgi:hypothetical protein
MAQGREERVDPSSRLACGIPCGCGALTAGEGMMGYPQRRGCRQSLRWCVGNLRYRHGYENGEVGGVKFDVYSALSRSRNSSM